MIQSMAHPIAGKSSRLKIEVVGLAKRYAGVDTAQPAVLDQINLTVAENEFVSLVGRSGCGQTTLLNIIAGLVAPSGRARSASTARWSTPGPGETTARGMVFQQQALFPWLTALQNVEFGARTRALSPKERRREAEQLIDLVGLTGYAGRYPAALSGGMLAARRDRPRSGARSADPSNT